jgi:protein-disulfide isomerase-like protein with CxxC motif
MPSWKKVTTSGSAASFSSLYVDTSVTASTFSGSQFIGNLSGTASQATSASLAQTASFVTTAQTASSITTLNQNVVISGSLTLSGSIGGAVTEFTVIGDTILSGSTTINGSTQVTGSLRVSQGITGSLLGTASTASYVETAQTASYVLQAVSASYALNAVSSSYALSASYVTLAQTASYVQVAQTAGTASYAFYAANAGSSSWAVQALTASYVASAVSASRATSAASADNSTLFNSLSSSQFPQLVVNNTFTGNNVFGNITASNAQFNTASIQYLNVVYETSSIIFSSGSNQFGDAANDVQTLWGTVTLPSGPLQVTGSLIATNLTGSLNGTNLVAASVANDRLTNSSVTVSAGFGLSGGGAVALGSSVSLSNAGVTSNVAGTGVAVSGATGAVTISIGQAVATTSNVQFNSLGVGTAGSTVAGEIRATADVTAYYSSDERLKEDITPIENPIEKLMSINGVTFSWKEGFETVHSHVGSDTGVVAQQIEAINLPGTVTTRETGYMAVNYEKLNALLIEGFKAQQGEINELKEIVKTLLNK